jgi:hypothetical protein
MGEEPAEAEVERAAMLEVSRQPAFACGRVAADEGSLIQLEVPSQLSPPASSSRSSIRR